MNKPELFYLAGSGAGLGRALVCGSRSLAVRPGRKFAEVFWQQSLWSGPNVTALIRELRLCKRQGVVELKPELLHEKQTVVFASRLVLRNRAGFRAGTCASS